MARLLDLADELLLLIFLHLDQSSLVALASVARRYRDIAQETLFENVDLLADTAHESKLVVSLVSTLVQRPELASKIRQISFHNPCQQETVADVTPAQVSAALTFVSTVEDDEDEEELLEQAEEYDEVWYGGIPDGAVVSYLAVLVGLVPNLKRLNVFERIDRGVSFPLPALFGEDAYGIRHERAPEIGFFPGLESVQHVRIHGGNFALATWYELPNLRKLELDCYQDYGGTEIDTQAHHEPDLDLLHTILVRCSACLLLPSEERDLDLHEYLWEWPRNPFEDLKYFTLPDRLEIEIVNVARVRAEDADEDEEHRHDMAIIGDARYGFFGLFFEELRALKRNLKRIKSLSIRYSRDSDFGNGRDFIVPGSDLTFLTGTKELTVPQEVILHPKQFAEGNPPQTLADFLPKKLESLCVLEADSRLLTWFEQILDAREQFPAFTKLSLEFESDAACEDLHAHCLSTDHSWKRFRDVGIDIVCCCHGRSYIPWTIPIR